VSARDAIEVINRLSNISYLLSVSKPSLRLGSSDNIVEVA
jgi:hypothetical protein